MTRSAWFLLQVVSATSASASAVAYWAHLGGFGFGLLLALAVRLRYGVPARPQGSLPARHESQVALPGAALLGGDWASERVFAVDDLTAAD